MGPFGRLFFFLALLFFVFAVHSRDAVERSEAEDEFSLERDDGGEAGKDGGGDVKEKEGGGDAKEGGEKGEEGEKEKKKKKKIAPIGTIPSLNGVGVMGEALLADPAKAAIVSAAKQLSMLNGEGRRPMEKKIQVELERAKDLLARMKTDVSNAKAWAKGVHEVIQNYQFKYTKTLSDIHARQSKMQKLKKLISQLQKAKLHTILEHNLKRASHELDELEVRNRDSAKEVTQYGEVRNEIQKLRHSLSKLTQAQMSHVTDIEHRIDDAVSLDDPPQSTDTLRQLVKETKKRSKKGEGGEGGSLKHKKKKEKSKAATSVVVSVTGSATAPPPAPK